MLSVAESNSVMNRQTLSTTVCDPQICCVVLQRVHFALLQGIEATGGDTGFLLDMLMGDQAGRHKNQHRNGNTLLLVHHWESCQLGNTSGSFLQDWVFLHPFTYWREEDCGSVFSMEGITKGEKRGEGGLLFIINKAAFDASILSFCFFLLLFI